MSKKFAILITSNICAITMFVISRSHENTATHFSDTLQFVYGSYTFHVATY
jgi:hypothetical protein